MVNGIPKEIPKFEMIFVAIEALWNQLANLE